MEPKIIIHFMDNSKREITCVGAGNEPWEEEEIQGMLDYYNSRQDVFYAVWL